MNEYTQKLHAGSEFPVIKVPTLAGAEVQLGHTRSPYDWQLVVVYRGRHCPMCSKYLTQLSAVTEQLHSLGVDVIAVSADSKEQLKRHLEELTVPFPIAYNLSLAQMRALGLYVSDPRSPEETDHPFAEPGLFVVNAQQRLHVVDISNNPFVRPELNTLVSGLKWIRDVNNNYPIRGMRKEVG